MSTPPHVNNFAVYGTLRDDCDALSTQKWTQKFIAGTSRPPRTAVVCGMKLVYKKSTTEDWPYAVMAEENERVTVRLLEFADNFGPKLVEADGVEQYDPEHPDDSPMGYKRRIVNAIVLDHNGKPTEEVVDAVMYYIDKFEPGVQYHHITTGDWVKREIDYYPTN